MHLAEGEGEFEIEAAGEIEPVDEVEAPDDAEIEGAPLFEGGGAKGLELVETGISGVEQRKLLSHSFVVGQRPQTPPHPSGPHALLRQLKVGQEGVNPGLKFKVDLGEEGFNKYPRIRAACPFEK